MLGVGTLIVVMSVMNGFRDKFLEQIMGFLGDISVLSRDAPKPLHVFAALVASIRQVPGVTDATPILDGQVLIQSDAKRWMGVAVRGTRIEDLKRNHDLADHLVAWQRSIRSRRRCDHARASRSRSASASRSATR